MTKTNKPNLNTSQPQVENSQVTQDQVLDINVNSLETDAKKQEEAKAEIKKIEKDSKPERSFKAIKLPDFKEFLKAGVQFGHQTNKWNPKMKQFIHSEKNGIHVLDLDKTMGCLARALNAIQQASYKGNVLIIATKNQARELAKEQALRVGSLFVTHRWPGGLLTNFRQAKKSLKRLNELEKMFEEGVEGRTKYEISLLKKEWERLNKLYGGVKYMSSLPELVVIVDTHFEKNALREANILKIPVVGIVDTNSDPSSIDFPIPANDDAIGSLKIMLNLVGDAILDGNQGGGLKHVFKDYKQMEVVRK